MIAFIDEGEVVFWPGGANDTIVSRSIAFISTSKVLIISKILLGLANIPAEKQGSTVSIHTNHTA